MSDSHLGKYVTSLIDNKVYCRKNGQFKRHLISHGYTYETYYIKFLGQQKLCICGKPCTFKPSKMEYLSCCGNSKCTGTTISKVKQSRTKDRLQLQSQRFRATMQTKTIEQLQQIKQKRIDTYKLKHGIDHRLQKQLTKDALAKLSDKQWMKYHHHDLQHTAVAISEQLGVGITTATNWLHRHQIELKLYRCSQVEREVLNYLQSCDSLLTVKSNDRTIISPLELDIVVPSKQLAIEINGVYWHGESKGKDRNYHIQKTNLCVHNNTRLIQITDQEWYTAKQIVKSRLAYLIGKYQPIYARQCSIEQLSPSQSNMFFNTNHLQGNVPARIVYGLIFNDTIVAAMSFGVARFSNAQFELLRYSNKLNTCVVGGASKLFNHFKKTFNPKSVVSYCDLRWNTGNLYSKLGFIHHHNSTPNYKYFKTSHPLTLYSRHRFQKHKLHKLLPIFDSSKSEWENMIDNGYDRIWDCGNGVYFWHMQ